MTDENPKDDDSKKQAPPRHRGRGVGMGSILNPPSSKPPERNTKEESQPPAHPIGSTPPVAAGAHQSGAPTAQAKFLVEALEASKKHSDAPTRESKMPPPDDAVNTTERPKPASVPPPPVEVGSAAQGSGPGLTPPEGIAQQITQGAREMEDHRISNPSVHLGSEHLEERLGTSVAAAAVVKEDDRPFILTGNLAPPAASPSPIPATTNRSALPPPPPGKTTLHGTPPPPPQRAPSPVPPAPTPPPVQQRVVVLQAGNPTPPPVPPANPESVAKAKAWSVGKEARVMSSLPSSKSEKWERDPVPEGDKPTIIPPRDKPTGLLGWIVLGVVAVAAALFGGFLLCANPEKNSPPGDHIAGMSSGSAATGYAAEPACKEVSAQTLLKTAEEMGAKNLAYLPETTLVTQASMMASTLKFECVSGCYASANVEKQAYDMNKGVWHICRPH